LIEQILNPVAWFENLANLFGDLFGGGGSQTVVIPRKLRHRPHIIQLQYTGISDDLITSPQTGAKPQSFASSSRRITRITILLPDILSVSPLVCRLVKRGCYYYIGGGFATPGTSVSLTFGTGEPTAGVQTGFQAQSTGPAAQYGESPGGSFHEIGAASEPEYLGRLITVFHAAK